MKKKGEKPLEENKEKMNIENEAKKDENEKEKLESCIYHLIEGLRKVAILLNPFVTNTSENMFKQLGITDSKLKQWDSIYTNENLEGTKVIEKGEPLFMRLDAEEEVEYIKNEMKK